MKKLVNHDSRDSKKGDFYQSLVAMKYAFEKEQQEFKTLTIEHKGDVSFDNSLHIETKHHITAKAMADTSEEFWKTLYNWLIQPITFDKYILHTTCHLPKGTNKLLRKFNNSNAELKLEIINKIDFGFSEDTILNYSFSKINIEIIQNLDIEVSTIETLSKIKGEKGKSEVIKILDDLNVSEIVKSLVLNHCKCTTNNQYKVWNYSRYAKSLKPEKLLALLSKMELVVEQENDIKLIKTLAKHPTFLGKCKTIEDIKYVIRDRVAGAIAAKVADEGKWEHSSFQFYNIISDALSKFFNENYRPSFEKYLKKNPTNEEIKKYSGTKFIDELNNVECKDSEIKIALVDFWKTTMVLDEELNINPTFVEEEYEPYKDGIVYKKLTDKKIRLEKHLDNTINISNSRNFYRDAKEMNFQSTGKINSLPYFSHGTMHNIVEDKSNDFKWLIDD